MSLLHSLIQRWRTVRDAARRELLRDPTVVLFERAPDTGFPGEGVHGR